MENKLLYEVYLIKDEIIDSAPVIITENLRSISLEKLPFCMVTMGDFNSLYIELFNLDKLVLEEKIEWNKKKC